MKPTTRAREMRKSLTPQEARLWSVLRSLRRQGFHFRRQAPLKGFFLDFVCFAHRLVVEVDGGQHADGPQADHDAARDHILARAGFRTLRVWNNEVNTNLEGVVYSILDALDRRSTPPRMPTASRRSSPSLYGEGGLKGRMGSAASPTRPASRSTLPRRGGREES